MKKGKSSLLTIALKEELDEEAAVRSRTERRCSRLNIMNNYVEMSELSEMSELTPRVESARVSTTGCNESTPPFKASV